MKRQAVMLILLAGLCGFAGTRAGPGAGVGARVASWGLFWLGADFAAVGVAYWERWPEIFGKRRDGTLPWWSWLVFAPFHAYSMLVWHLGRFLRPSAAFHAVTPDLVVGRRLIGTEWPPDEHGFANIIDLTAEFQEAHRIRCSAGYQCVAILDGSVPTPEVLRDVIRGLAPGRTYVHCAQGYGRTGLFAAALLLNQRAVKTASEAVATLRAARSRVRLNPVQQKFLSDYERLMGVGGRDL